MSGRPRYLGRSSRSRPTGATRADTLRKAVHASPPSRWTDRSLVAARLSEARTLLELNQTRRARAEGVLALIPVLGLIGAIVAIATRRPEVFLPFPPVALGLTSLSFQQYADVNVLARARIELEHAVNGAVGGPALLYESRIAEIRKTRPLVDGVRLLQALAHVGTMAAVIAGTIVVAEHRWWIIATYLGATLVAAGSCWLSHAGMRNAWKVTGDALGEL